MKTFKFLLLIIFIIFVFYSFAYGISDISPADVKEKVGNGAIIVDVRTPEEYSSGHILEAVNIPLQDIKKRIRELDNTKEIILYCRSGRRSSIAKEILLKNGFKKVYNGGGYSDLKEVFINNK